MKPLQLVNQLLRPLRLELVRKQKLTPRAPYRPPLPGEPLKLYVGCGEDAKEGYMGVDLRKLPTVDIVCRAWEISYHQKNVDEIYTRHMVEHLTVAEADRTLADWYKALAPGGKVHIVVPDLDFHIAQWQRAEWTEEALKSPTSDAAHSRAGFFGWQRECDPAVGSYNQTYWDVHKSGYNKAYMTFLLQQKGFQNIEVKTVDQCHLVAIAEK